MGTNYENVEVSVNRAYKDTIFRMLFKDKENLLSLYNAVNGTAYDKPEELEMVTLENAVYMSMKNDHAFILDCQLNLYEHQSTINLNMPLRFLNYVAAEFRRLTKNSSLYSTKQITLPYPNFIVFYNGTDDAPERDFLNLSDAFEWSAEKPNLELIVTQLNINAGFNEGIKDACQLLKEYMLYVEQVRLFAKEMPLKQAVEKAVDFCIAAGILEDFLRQNRAEAIEVSIFEYNAEREMRLLREEIAADSRAAGLAEGRAAGMAVGLAEGREEGRAAGLVEGRAEGRNQLMVSIVCKRLQLGDSPEMIADLVMEPLPEIVKVCDIAAKYAPNYDVEKIAEEMMQ